MNQGFPAASVPLLVEKVVVSTHFVRLAPISNLKTSDPLGNYEVLSAGGMLHFLQNRALIVCGLNPPSMDANVFDE